MNDDRKWILRCLELAKRGHPLASPNPLVGCVIVKGGRLIAEGAHLKFGGPHAEIRALRTAGKRARGATMYVSLEPCCHWGKTPPCVDAIIGSGIKKVVAAMADPNPVVHGNGFKTLKSAGIKVTSGVFEKEARELNRSFIKFSSQKKPYVILKSAVSLDGKIASRSGDSKWISSGESRNLVHKLRSECDGILVGAETVRTDNPELTSHGAGRNPVRIILTKSGKIPKTSKVFNDDSPTWVYKNIKIPGLMNELAERGISRLLVEGGGNVAAEFIESGEVDEAVYFIAPIWIGGESAKTSFEGKGFPSVHKALKLEIVENKRIGPDIYIRALVKK